MDLLKYTQLFFFIYHTFWKENTEDTIEISRFNLLLKGNNSQFA